MEKTMSLAMHRAWQQFLDVLTGCAGSAECPTLEDLTMESKMTRAELHKRIEEITLPLEELGLKHGEDALYELADKLSDLEERLMEEGVER